MKKREAGQGLVEYALILVLVAIVVIAILLLLGPVVSLACYDDTITNYGGNEIAYPTSIDPVCISRGSTTPLTLDYFADGLNFGFRKSSLSVTIPPRFGEAEGNLDDPSVAIGTIRYTPTGGQFVQPDDFYIRLCLYDGRCGEVRQYIGVCNPEVNPHLGNCLEPDATAMTRSGATIVTTSFTTTDQADQGDAIDANWEQVYEQSEPFIRQTRLQENGYLQALFFASEAFNGATTIISDYAIATGNNELQDGITSIVQAVYAGDEATIISTFTAIAPELAQIPDNVQMDVLIEIEPFIIDAYHALYGIVVTEASFNAALDAWVEQEASNPGSTLDAIPGLLQRWEISQERNQTNEELQAVLKEGISIVIGVLENSGDETYISLAKQYEADFYWGNLDEAIDKALIDNDGIRNSLQAKANAARSAYDNNDMVESGAALCDLQNELNAQDGKHVDTHSTTLIRDTVTDLAEGLGISLSGSE